MIDNFEIAAATQYFGGNVFDIVPSTAKFDLLNVLNATFFETLHVGGFNEM